MSPPQVSGVRTQLQQQLRQHQAEARRHGAAAAGRRARPRAAPRAGRQWCKYFYVVTKYISVAPQPGRAAAPSPPHRAGGEAAAGRAVRELRAVRVRAADEAAAGAQAAAVRRGDGGAGEGGPRHQQVEAGHGSGGQQGQARPRSQTTTTTFRYKVIVIMNVSFNHFVLINIEITTSSIHTSPGNLLKLRHLGGSIHKMKL